MTQCIRTNDIIRRWYVARSSAYLRET